MFKVIGKIDRNKLLPYKTKDNFLTKGNQKNILFFLNFNYNIDCKNLIYNSFYHCKNNSYFKDYKLLYINRVNLNINNILTNNFKIQKFCKFKTEKCNELNCNICKFIYDKYYIDLNYNNLKLNLLSNATCNTENIIYIIICTKCNLYYIGETSKKLKERIQQHLNNINNFIPFIKYHDKIIAKHFRSNNHSLKELKVCVFKTNLENLKERKDKEQDLINFLNLKTNNCLNIIKTKNSKNFVFL
jgi:uncharacterized protein with HEPN domain